MSEEEQVTIVPLAPVKRKLTEDEDRRPNTRKRTRSLFISIPADNAVQKVLINPSPTPSIFADLPPLDIEQDSDTDSLFDSPDSEATTAFSNSTSNSSTVTAGVVTQTEPASLKAPPIPGLTFDPTLLLPQPLIDYVFAQCISTYFTKPLTNQVMLFCRPDSSTLPLFLADLLSAVSDLLQPKLSRETHDLLFASRGRARQAIVNLYEPGDGISPHVDLLDRFGDGIVGVSMGSGCVMEFKKGEKRHGMYLPPRSTIIICGEARYEWTHGIEKKVEDAVARDDGRTEVVKRGTRMSITFRWLLPGADVVGGRTGDKEE